MVYFKRKEDKFRAVMWGGIALILPVYFFSMYYSDIWVTYNYGLIFWDCLWEGRVFDFYEICLPHAAEFTYAANYFIPLYLIFAVWNIPVWIATRLCGAATDSIGCLLWSKGLIVLFAVGCVWMICRILKKRRNFNMEWAAFLFASSLLFVFPALVIAQYDVIELFFILWGIYYYLKDEKLSWRTLLIFSVAISLKLFAIFILLLLVLIEEKRILHIGIDLLLGMLFTIITMLPFYGNGFQSYAGVTGFAWELFRVTGSAGLAYSGFSLFWLGYFGICMAAYLSKRKSILENCTLLIWLATAFWMWLFIFVSGDPNWYVLILPFFIFLMTEYRENLKINLLLETALEIVIIVAQGLWFGWGYFSEGVFSRLIFRDSARFGKGARNLPELLGWESGIPGVLSGLYAVFIGCGIALLVINNPWKPILVDHSEGELVVAERVGRIVRVGAVILCLALTFAIVFWL